METVYVETSVIGYLTSKRSGDLVTAAHQQTTEQWWRTERNHFELHASELVLEESNRGDPNQARARLRVLDGLSILRISPQSRELAELYVTRIPVLHHANADALHLAIASMNRLDYVLTWNCRHIARAVVRRAVVQINTELGLPWPEICTPEELIHGDSPMD